MPHPTAAGEEEERSEEGTEEEEEEDEEEGEEEDGSDDEEQHSEREEEDVAEERGNEAAGAGAAVVTQGAPEEKTRAAPGKPAQQDDKVLAEVTQLQGMVNNCVKIALKGCPCRYLQQGSDKLKRIPSRYFVDDNLEQLSIVACEPEQGSGVQVKCSIAAIQDIFCVSEDGEAPFPTAVMSRLQKEEKETLLMVVFQGRQVGVSSFCVMLETCESRESFMEAMRVLCVASRFSATVDHRNETSAPRGGQVMDLAPQVNSSLHSQQVSVDFFMRCIGIKAMMPTDGSGDGVPLPPLMRQGVVQYISAYGYKPKDENVWQVSSHADFRPRLLVCVRQHIEAAKHTWYIVESSLMMDEHSPVRRLDWLAPRRLAHLRRYLHHPLKEALRESYSKHFEGASFACRLGPPGTTERLHRWFSALSGCINAKKAPPLVVALTLHFLEAPCPTLNPDGNRPTAIASLTRLRGHASLATQEKMRQLVGKGR